MFQYGFRKLNQGYSRILLLKIKFEFERKFKDVLPKTFEAKLNEASKSKFSISSCQGIAEIR